MYLTYVLHLRALVTSSVLIKLQQSIKCKKKKKIENNIGIHTLWQHVYCTTQLVTNEQQKPWN